jgi:cytochrome c-type biogenesis protein CcmH
MRTVILMLVALLAGPGFAREAVPVAEDPVIEQRLIDISGELRCLVCQNESLAASRAELALDLRREIRTLIARGDSDDAIRSFLTDRYGDFILYRPQFKRTTLLLWLGPVLLLLIGLALLFRQLRRRSRESKTFDQTDAELSHDERAALANLLTEEAPLASSGEGKKS